MTSFATIIRSAIVLLLLFTVLTGLACPLAVTGIAQAVGNDPAHGGDAGKSRGRRNANHHAAVSEWEREAIEKPEPETFTCEILPLLHDVPLSKMAKATGLTEGYCSFVRRGLKAPHRRHWSALADLGNKNSG